MLYAPGNTSGKGGANPILGWDAHFLLLEACRGGVYPDAGKNPGTGLSVLRGPIRGVGLAGDWAASDVSDGGMGGGSEDVDRRSSALMSVGSWAGRYGASIVDSLPRLVDPVSR